MIFKKKKGHPEAEGRRIPWLTTVVFFYGIPRFARNDSFLWQLRRKKKKSNKGSELKLGLTTIKSLTSRLSRLLRQPAVTAPKSPGRFLYRPKFINIRSTALLLFIKIRGNSMKLESISG